MTMTCSMDVSAAGARGVVVAQATTSSAAARTAPPRRLTRSGDLDELLQTAQPGRNGPAPAPVGVRHLPHVDVAARVHGQAVRRDELAGLEPGRPIAEPRQQVALGAVDAHARADVRHVDVDSHAAADLADVEARGAAVEEEAGGPVHVDPLRLELPPAVEDLDAMVLAVGHVHPALGVTRDVVRDVELPRVGAGLAPRAEQLAVGRVSVDARVAVAVGDV